MPKREFYQSYGQYLEKVEEDSLPLYTQISCRLLARYLLALQNQNWNISELFSAL